MRRFRPKQFRKALNSLRCLPSLGSAKSFQWLIGFASYIRNRFFDFSSAEFLGSLRHRSIDFDSFVTQAKASYRPPAEGGGQDERTEPNRRDPLLRRVGGRAWHCSRERRAVPRRAGDGRQLHVARQKMRRDYFRKASGRTFSSSRKYSQA